MRFNPYCEAGYPAYNPIMTSSSFHERLRAARIAAGFRTKREFTDTHGIAYTTYHNHEGGGREPDIEIKKRYASIFGVDDNWLILGTGSGPSQDGAIEEIQGDEIHIRPTSGQRRLLDLCDQLRRSILRDEPTRAARIAETIAADMRLAELDR